MKILFEDSHILVVEKPPKVPSQSDKTGDKDLYSELKEYLLKQYNTKNPYLGLIHRLDRPVGGVMLFAKTKFSNSKLSQQIQNKTMQKKYYAVVNGKPKVMQEELRDYLVKDGRRNISKVISANDENGKEALLVYKCLDTLDTGKDGILSLLEIELKTGRHHQIRVQLSNVGLPIWGDTKYNSAFSRRRGWTQIALWASCLSFYHPKTGKELIFTSIPMSEYPFTLFRQRYVK